MKRIGIIGGCLLASLMVVVACTPLTGVEPDTFDRTAMLRNYADNLIQPAFIDLQTQTTALQNAVETFTTTPTISNLTAAQAAWTKAYLSFQYANTYNFGPAGEQGTRKKLSEEAATFPVSTTKIETAIAAGNTSLNDFNRDARGFLAVEYLIFSITNDNNGLVSQFQQSANRQAYLLALSKKLKTQTDEIVTAWNASYTTDFITNNGTAAGSSTSQLFNEFVASFEEIKNYKLGLPLGKRVGQTQPEPTKVEAYYSGKSLEMITAHLAAIENIWYGRTKDGKDGIGFKEYLDAAKGGQELIVLTEKQLAVIHAAQKEVPLTTPLSTQITTNKQPIEKLYTELQKQVPFFKSSMSSLMGIAITFSSGDGD